MIWGLLITCGSKLLECNDNAKEPLLKMSRYLQTTSNSADGWGEGLLGAIGLKKETISTKCVILCDALNFKIIKILRYFGFLSDEEY